MTHSTSPTSPHEKYQTDAAFRRAYLKRELIRNLLRPLMRWKPLEHPEPGYTIVIGSMLPLSNLLRGNLKLLARQQLDGLHEVLIVTDTVANDATRATEAELRAAAPELPLRFLYHHPLQRAVLERINWAWCDLWLSWALGIGATRTRYVLLHDLDAMLLRPNFLQERHEHIQKGGQSFLGVRFYEGNGITPADGLAVTFEMILDTRHIRNRFRPMDLFNKVRRLNGRRVELDTFLNVQTRTSGSSSALPVEEEDMVHPSQLICQYAGLTEGRAYRLPERNNLPLLPYFCHVAGDDHILDQHRRAFDRAAGHDVAFLGETMDASLLTRNHLAWLVKQATRLEHKLHGEMRPEVDAYFASIASFLDRRDGADPRPDASVAREHPAMAGAAKASHEVVK